jgi:hypothetical protein
MIGRPRQGDMLVRSASAETIRNAPTVAARSRIRSSSPVRTVPDGLRRAGDAATGRVGHLGQRPQVVIDLVIRGLPEQFRLNNLPGSRLYQQGASEGQG